MGAQEVPLAVCRARRLPLTRMDILSALSIAVCVGELVLTTGTPSPNAMLGVIKKP